MPHLPVVKASGTVDELALPALLWVARRVYNAISSNKRHAQDQHHRQRRYLPHDRRSSQA